MGCCTSTRKPTVIVSAPARQQQPQQQETHIVPIATTEQRPVNTIHVDSPVVQEEGDLGFICEVKLPGERNACNITDSVELPGGQLVLCDQRNGKLFMFDRDLQFQSDVTLGGQPFKITDIPWREDCLAVSILIGDRIQYVKVTNGIFHQQEIALQTSSRCRGIDCTRNMLIYVMDDVITMQDQDNNILNLAHDFEKPVSIAVDRKTESVYILCEESSGFARLLKAKLDGNIREFDYRYRDIRSPVSLCRDKNGCLFICSRDPPAIHKVTQNGEYCGAVYTARFGLFQHLQYCKTSDVFVLSKPNTNTLSIFRFK